MENRRRDVYAIDLPQGTPCIKKENAIWIIGGDHVVVERFLANAVGVWTADDAFFHGSMHGHDVVHDARNGGRGGHYTNAVDILNERFARGELTQSEYEERRRVLKA